MSTPNSTPTDQEWIADLSREIVGEVAPEELELFDQLAGEYFVDPSPPDLSQKAKDDALGFGLGDVLIAATPAATAMVSLVLSLAVDALKKAAADQGADFLREQVKALVKGKQPATPAGSPVTFSQEHLRSMYQAAVEEARRFGMSEADAQRMADTLFRRMALGQ